MKASTRHNDPNHKTVTLIGRARALSGRVRWTGIGLLLLAVTFAVWLGLGVFQAKSSFEQAKTSAERSKDALLSGKSEEATRWAENAQFHAQRARSATHSPPWNIVAAVPLLGSPLKTTQQISDVVAGLANDILIPGARLGSALSPDKLIDGDRINLKLLRAEEASLSKLATAASKLDAGAQEISSPAYLSLIRDARSQLQDQTSQLAQLLGNTAMAAKLAPSMLGADGPRTYLMAFQNNAEARGTGGLLGGFGVIRFENGTPTIDLLAPNTELDQATAKIDLGPDFNQQYEFANPYTDYRNSNLSPNFPYAARIWKSMWEEQSGITVDGVITVDPVALSYLLGATGPVTLADGEVINQENVVELTQSTAYSRFKPLEPPDIPPDPAGRWCSFGHCSTTVYRAEQARINSEAASALRKKYLQAIATAVVKKVTGPLSAPQKFLNALGRAASEQRIAVWSAHPSEQAVLENTPLAHMVPDDSAPYAQVIINNLSGNKMDYYLRREIEYAADGCDSDRRNSTITVKLSNIAAPGAALPEYVAGLQGLAPWISLKAPNGTMVSSVRVLATKGSTLLSVTSNGERTQAITHRENGRPSFEVQVAIPPGQSGDLTFRLSEPTSPGEPRVPIQPLIDNVTPKVMVPTCPG